MAGVYPAFEALRVRREELGITLEGAGDALRIPVEHLRSIEDGRIADLPRGPYRKGYLRAYCEHLGVDPDALIAEAKRGAELTEEVPPPAAPSWAPRVVAAVVCLALLGLLAVQLRAGATASGEGEVPVPTAPLPDQQVKVTVERAAHLRILVDGEQVLDRRARPGEVFDVAGHDRVEVDLPAAEVARVEYNGEAVVPQGRQDAPRRLVFIDDVAGGP